MLTDDTKYLRNSGCGSDVLSKWHEIFENQGAAVTCLANDTKHAENHGAAVTCLASDATHHENRGAEVTCLVNGMLVAIWPLFQNLKSTFGSILGPTLCCINALACRGGLSLLTQCAAAGPCPIDLP